MIPRCRIDTSASRPRWRFWPVDHTKTAQGGLDWVLRHWHFATINEITIRISNQGVSGCNRPLDGRRRRCRIEATIPSDYPATTYHARRPHEDVWLADAAEAVVFILGHEIYHVGGRHGEPAADDQGVQWLARFRAERASRHTNPTGPTR